jgi:hypothetical protein
MVDNKTRSVQYIDFFSIFVIVKPMRRKKMLNLKRKAGVKAALIGAVCVLAALVPGACTIETDDAKVDQRLVGSWTNNKDDPLLEIDTTRTFTIRADGSFVCSINPAGQGRGTVTGLLTRSGNEYIMSGLREITGTKWGNAVGGYNTTNVQITIEESGTHFFFGCENDPTVEDFFGGDYEKLP